MVLDALGKPHHRYYCCGVTGAASKQNDIAVSQLTALVSAETGELSFLFWSFFDAIRNEK